MRCYLVTAKSNEGKTLARRLSATNADARAMREDLMETFEVKKKNVEIDDHDVPTPKPALLAYLNDLLVEQDSSESKSESESEDDE